MIATGLLLVANLGYLCKSIMKIDLFKGHHGNLFPLGDALRRDWVATHKKR
jgi:hypothetical protein